MCSLVGGMLFGVSGLLFILMNTGIYIVVIIINTLCQIYIIIKQQVYFIFDSINRTLVRII